MPAPPRIRLLPLAAIALALAMIYLAWPQQRPQESAPREPAAPTTTAQTTEIRPAPVGDMPEAQSPRPDSEPDDAPAIAVSGRITDAQGTPVGGIAVELQALDDATGASVARARSNRRGEFGFDTVTPDRPYQLRVAPTDVYAGYSDDSVTFSAATPRLDITLERIALVDAEGIVVDTSGAPVANFTLRLRSASTNLPEQAITSDASGYFRLEEFPAGELEINTSGRDFYRIGGLALEADRYNNLTLVVDRGDYRLSGRVVDESGAPVADARITLKGALWHEGAHSYSYRSALTNEEGGFAFDDLGSYRYTVGIHAAGFETQIRDHEFQSFAERLEIRLQPLPID